MTRLSSICMHSMRAVFRILGFVVCAVNVRKGRLPGNLGRGFSWGRLVTYCDNSIPKISSWAATKNFLLTLVDGSRHLSTIENKPSLPDTKRARLGECHIYMPSAQVGFCRTPKAVSRSVG